MRTFDYVRADSAEAAVRGAGGAAKFIAGGTNLLDLMKIEVEAPETLIDISRLPLGEIEANGEGLRIGALVRNSDLAADRRIRQDYAVLSRALLAGASGQLRNKATTGGNLLQRTRCYYFYDPALSCNKRVHGSGCGAIGGVNRIHAILGASEQCIATHPSDMAVAMLVLDAEVETDRRTIPIGELHRLPGDTPQIETMLDADELIVGVNLPKPIGGTHIYRKVRDRASYAFALVSIAAVIEMDGDTIAVARLAFGGVAHKPWRDSRIEEMLVGNPPSDALFAEVADTLLADARGQGENDFKIPLLRRTLIAVLREATEANR